MVLILFRNVSLCYGDATKDQVGSSARKRIRLGQRQTRVVRLAAWAPTKTLMCRPASDRTPSTQPENASRGCAPTHRYTIFGIASSASALRA